MKSTDTHEQVKFCVHPPMEFFLAMHDMAIESDEQKRRGILNFVPRNETQNMVETMRGKLTAYQRSELTQFFTKGLQFTLTKFITNNPSVKTIPDIIKLVEATDETLLLKYMTRSSLYIHWYEKGIKTCWEDVSGDLDFLISQVKNSKIQDDELTRRMLDFLENPQETKQRYYSILKQFYYKCYEQVEDKILERLNTQKDKLKENCLKDPKEFFKKLLFSNLDSFRGDVNIHISFFIQQGLMNFMPWDKNLPHWITWGIDEDAANNKENISAKAMKLFKALSDEKRFDMMNLFCSRPWYAQELADQLSIPASSVNYHLNHFMELELLDIQRINHRIYYSINKAKLKKIFDQAIKQILQE